LKSAATPSNQVNAVFEREVEQENLLEPVGDRKPAQGLHLRFANEELAPALGLGG